MTAGCSVAATPPATPTIFEIKGDFESSRFVKRFRDTVHYTIELNYLNHNTMNKIYLLLVAVMLMSFSGQTCAQKPLLAFEASPFGGDAKMHVTSTDNPGADRRTELLYDADNNFAINDIVSAAYHPTDDEVYVIASTEASGLSEERKVFRVDTLTGAMTFVTDPQDDYWQALAISDDGRFFVVPGPSSGVAEQNAIYELDISTGAISMMTTIYPGESDEKGLAFNPDDGQLYVTAAQDTLIEDSTLVGYDINDWSAEEIQIIQDADIILETATYMDNDTLLFTESSPVSDYTQLDVNGGAPTTVQSFPAEMSYIRGLAVMYNATTSSRESGLAQSEQQPTVYPNPAHNMLNIDLPNNRDANIRLLDLQGRTLLSQTANNSNATLNVSGIANGLYLLKSPQSTVPTPSVSWCAKRSSLYTF